MHDARAKMSCNRDREDSPQQRWSMPRRKKEVRAISSSSLHVVKLFEVVYLKNYGAAASKASKEDLALDARAKKLLLKDACCS